MFFVAVAFLVWSLFTFGGVLPSSSFAIAMAWFSSAALLTVWRIVRHDRLDSVLLVAFIAGGLALYFPGPKISLWILSGMWAWAAQRENPRRVFQYFHLLLLVGVLEASLGLIQYFVAPGWILGYQNTSGNVMSGTLINRNHFAGLIEMLIPCSIGLGFIAARRYDDLSRSYFYILAGALMSLSLVFSLSRMGVFSFLLTLLLICTLLVFRKSQRNLGLGLSVGLLGLLLAGVFWVGIDVIIERYVPLLGKEAVIEDGRLLVYSDTIRMIRFFPQGTGIGQYPDHFRRFQTSHLELFFDHPHNDYLETIAEWGVLPGLVFWSVVGFIFFRLVRALFRSEFVEEQGVLLACIGSTFSILVHSFADFNLQIPSNAILFFSFIGVGLGVLYPRRIVSSLGNRLPR